MCRLTRPSLEDSGPTAKKQDQEAVSSSFFGFKIPHRKSRFPLDSPRCTERFFFRRGFSRGAAAYPGAARASIDLTTFRPGPKGPKGPERSEDPDAPRVGR
jgi:hypothetical protein